MRGVDVRLLGELPLFAAMSAEQRAALALRCELRRFRSRQTVVQQGEPGDAAYVVASGYLKVSISGRDGHISTLGIMHRGDIFGEVSLLDGGPRSASIVALTRSELVVLERAQFLSAIRTDSQLAIGLLAVMGRRLRQLSDRSDDIGNLCVGARIARRLILLCHQHGQPLGPNRLRIAVKLSQQDLGDLVDATRESVNKHLKLWEHEGLLRTEGGHLVVTNLLGLQQTAEHFDARSLRAARRRAGGPAGKSRARVTVDLSDERAPQRAGRPARRAAGGL
jgi:CRP-like cAMP-binding protein